jgi:hypothetical protein
LKLMRMLESFFMVSTYYELLPLRALRPFLASFGVKSS